VYWLPEEERAHALEGRETKVLDLKTLTCERNGRRVMYVHIGQSPKPWQPEARSRIVNDAYTKLVRRLFHWDDVPLQLPSEELPRWLRKGPSADLTLIAFDFLHGIPWRQSLVAVARRLLPESLYARLRGVYRRRRARGRAA
jgi:hypothetical protein